MHCTLVCLGYDATEPTIFSVLMPLCSIFPSSQWRLIQSAFQPPQYSLRVKNWITSLRLRMLDGSKSFWWISKCRLETSMGAGDGKFCAYYFLSFHLAQDSSLWNWGVLTAYPSEWVFRKKKKKKAFGTHRADVITPSEKTIYPGTFYRCLGWSWIPLHPGQSWFLPVVLENY